MLPYLFKLSIAVMVVFLFYHWVLRRLTFYNWNRWYLLFYAAICFVIPFINIDPVLQKSQLDANQLIVLIPSLSGAPIAQISSPNEAWNLENCLLVLLLLGSILMTLRILLQHFSLIRMKRSARLMVNDKVKLYQVDKSIIPFSFGNSIFVNQYQHSEQELQEIIRHEFIHVKQHHTLDILFAELFCILNWYNPFAWLIRNAIRQNLEFIADREVLQKGIDKKEYQYLLLKVIGVSQFSIATKFNFTSLKKRIAMMNKMRTAKVHLVKFLFMFPILLVLLVSFREQLSGAVAPLPFTDSGFGDTIPATVIKKTGVKMPDSIQSIKVNNEVITVQLKNGRKETYDQRKPADRAAFDKKYGSLLPPPPPPPLAPRSPKASVTPPEAPGLPDKEDWVRATANSKGYILSVADNNGECIVIIKNKQGKIEKSMLLTDWTAQEKTNEAKYGVLPPPPPPAPPTAPKAPKFGVKEPGNIPAPGADAGIIKAPAEGYYINADKIEYNAKGNGTSRENIRLSGNNGIVIKGQSEALIVIDGKVQEGQEALHKLNPEDISQIDVLKNESATALYGEKGKNGVLLITTKREQSGSKVIIPDAGQTPPSFYLVNGKEYSSVDFKNLNLSPNDISSIHVWKGETAVKQFGERGRNGVIEVKTK